MPRSDRCLVARARLLVLLLVSSVPAAYADTFFVVTSTNTLLRWFGALVQSLGGSPAPLVVERSVYTAVNGVPFVAGTNNLGTRLQ